MAAVMERTGCPGGEGDVRMREEEEEGLQGEQQCEPEREEQRRLCRRCSYTAAAEVTGVISGDRDTQGARKGIFCLLQELAFVEGGFLCSAFRAVLFPILVGCSSPSLTSLRLIAFLRARQLLLRELGADGSEGGKSDEGKRKRRVTRWRGFSSEPRPKGASREASSLRRAEAVGARGRSVSSGSSLKHAETNTKSRGTVKRQDREEKKSRPAAVWKDVDGQRGDDEERMTKRRALLSQLYVYALAALALRLERFSRFFASCLVGVERSLSLRGRHGDVAELPTHAGVLLMEKELLGDRDGNYVAYGSAESVVKRKEGFDVAPGFREDVWGCGVALSNERRKEIWCLLKRGVTEAEGAGLVVFFSNSFQGASQVCTAALWGVSESAERLGVFPTSSRPTGVEPGEATRQQKERQGELKDSQKTSSFHEGNQAREPYGMNTEEASFLRALHTAGIGSEVNNESPLMEKLNLEASAFFPSNSTAHTRSSSLPPTAGSSSSPPLSPLPSSSWGFSSCHSSPSSSGESPVVASSALSQPCTTTPRRTSEREKEHRQRKTRPPGQSGDAHHLPPPLSSSCMSPASPAVERVVSADKVVQNWEEEGQRFLPPAERSQIRKDVARSMRQWRLAPSGDTQALTVLRLGEEMVLRVQGETGGGESAEEATTSDSRDGEGRGLALEAAKAMQQPCRVPEMSEESLAEKERARSVGSTVWDASPRKADWEKEEKTDGLIKAVENEVRGDREQTREKAEVHEDATGQMRAETEETGEAFSSKGEEDAGEGVGQESARREEERGEEEGREEERSAEQRGANARGAEEDVICLRGKLEKILASVVARHYGRLFYTQGMHDVAGALLLLLMNAGRFLLHALRKGPAAGAPSSVSLRLSTLDRPGNTPPSSCSSLCSFSSLLSLHPEVVAYLSSLAFALTERLYLFHLCDFFAASLEASLLPALSLLSLFLGRYDPPLHTVFSCASTAAAVDPKTRRHTRGGSGSVAHEEESPSSQEEENSSDLVDSPEDEEEEEGRQENTEEEESRRGEERHDLEEGNSEEVLETAAGAWESQETHRAQGLPQFDWTSAEGCDGTRRRGEGPTSVSSIGLDRLPAGSCSSSFSSAFPEVAQRRKRKLARPFPSHESALYTLEEEEKKPVELKHIRRSVGDGRHIRAEDRGQRGKRQGRLDSPVSPSTSTRSSATSVFSRSLSFRDPPSFRSSTRTFSPFRSSGLEFQPCTSWLITFFAHSFSSFPSLCRFLECALTSHPLFALHFAAVVISFHRGQIFEAFEEILEASAAEGALPWELQELLVSRRQMKTRSRACQKKGGTGDLRGKRVGHTGEEVLEASRTKTENKEADEEPMEGEKEGVEEEVGARRERGVELLGERGGRKGAGKGGDCEEENEEEDRTETGREEEIRCHIAYGEQPGVRGDNRKEAPEPTNDKDKDDRRREFADVKAKPVWMERADEEEKGAEERQGEEDSDSERSYVSECALGEGEGVAEKLIEDEWERLSRQEEREERGQKPSRLFFFRGKRKEEEEEEVSDRGLLEDVRDRLGDSISVKLHAILQNINFDALPLERLLQETHRCLEVSAHPREVLRAARRLHIRLPPFSPLYNYPYPWMRKKSGSSFSSLPNLDPSFLTPSAVGLRYPEDILHSLPCPPPENHCCLCRMRDDVFDGSISCFEEGLCACAAEEKPRRPGEADAAQEKQRRGARERTVPQEKELESATVQRRKGGLPSLSERSLFSITPPPYLFVPAAENSSPGGGGDPVEDVGEGGEARRRQRSAVKAVKYPSRWVSLYKVPHPGEKRVRTRRREREKKKKKSAETQDLFSVTKLLGSSTRGRAVFASREEGAGGMWWSLVMWTVFFFFWPLAALYHWLIRLLLGRKPDLFHTSPATTEGIRSAIPGTIRSFFSTRSDNENRLTEKKKK